MRQAELPPNRVDAGAAEEQAAGAVAGQIAAAHVRLQQVPLDPAAHGLGVDMQGVAEGAQRDEIVHRRCGRFRPNWGRRRPGLGHDLRRAGAPGAGFELVEIVLVQGVAGVKQAHGLRHHQRGHLVAVHRRHVGDLGGLLQGRLGKAAGGHKDAAGIAVRQGADKAIHLGAGEGLAQLLHLDAGRHAQDPPAHQLAAGVDPPIAAVACHRDGGQAQKGQQVPGKELERARAEGVEAIFDLGLEMVGHGLGRDWKRVSWLYDSRGGRGCLWCSKRRCLSTEGERGEICAT